jgi:hypothetical protein
LLKDRLAVPDAEEQLDHPAVGKAFAGDRERLRLLDVERRPRIAGVALEFLGRDPGRATGGGYRIQMRQVAPQADPAADLDVEGVQVRKRDLRDPVPRQQP